MHKLTAFPMYALTILALLSVHPVLAIVLFLGIDLGALAGVLLAFGLALAYGPTFYTLLALTHVILFTMTFAAMKSPIAERE